MRAAWLVGVLLAGCGSKTGGPGPGSDGGGDAGGALDGPAQFDLATTSKLYAFVSTATFRGDQVNLTAGGADLACIQEAMAAGLGGMGSGWVSWNSTSMRSALSRLPNGGPWYLSDRTTKLFDNSVQLVGMPQAPIDRDASGNPISRTATWTGTAANGTSPANCADWTSQAATTAGTVGDTGDTTGWTDSGALPCNSAPHPVYCFQTVAP